MPLTQREINRVMKEDYAIELFKKWKCYDSLCEGFIDDWEVRFKLSLLLPTIKNLESKGMVIKGSIPYQGRRYTTYILNEKIFSR